MTQQALTKRPNAGEERIDEITESPSSSSTHEQHEKTCQPASESQNESRDGSLRKSRHATEHLHRQGYIIYLVLFYAAMLCTSWTILVITSKRPIGRSTYNCFDENNYCPENSDELAYQNSRTTRYISNAQTLLSAVSLLTIPLTSAVCAAAVVPWLQQSGQGMSLRQIMTLSDKGWTSPYVYYRLLLPSGWKRYGSSFIALALLLHALGAALSPAINQMSTLVAVKVPRSSIPPTLYVIGLHDLFGFSDPQRLSILRLRNLLKTANPTQIRPQIWVPKIVDCDTQQLGREQYYLPNSTQCTNGGMTYLSLTTEPEAWISQLASGFATGVKTKQFIPRFNTSVQVELLNELPMECNPIDAALLINYVGSSVSIDYPGPPIYDWSIRVCIPEYNSTTFNDTDSAQTLIETAYFDLFTNSTMDAAYHNVSRVTMSTTTGMFELPNYLNENVPGPLIQNFNSSSSSVLDRRQFGYDLSLEKSATQKTPDLETMPNRGPLLNIIYALFGNGSMPSIYSTENMTYNPGSRVPGAEISPCLDVVPLSSLIDAFSPSNGSGINYRDECLNYQDLAQGDQMHSFLLNFFIPTQALERLFRAAAYMNHEILLTDTYAELDVIYDPGQDLQKPGLQDRAIIAITVAIAVFLLSLLMLAFYASFSKTWTSSLDAHALLRIGAELGKEALPFLVIKDAHHIGELDELPGWVGDVTEDDDTKDRQLGMGWNGLTTRQVRPVRKDGLYLSYPNMKHRGTLQVFCLWCDTVFGLCGLRRTRAGLNFQRAHAQLQESNQRNYARRRAWWDVRKGRVIQKIGPWLRQTRIGKWYNGDYLLYPRSQEETPVYKSVSQTSVV